jgi:hypothetical protein
MSYFLFGNIITCDNDALDPGSEVLMQGTGQMWKTGIEFFGVRIHT